MRFAAGVCLGLALCAPMLGSVAGVVRGPRGEAVAGAAVQLETPGASVESVATDAAGRFAFPTAGPAAGAVLRVQAPGYLPWRRPLRSGAPADEIGVTLSPDRASEEITVTAARVPRRIGDTPASVVVLDREDLAATAAPAADDALRQVAGFQLFRRSGSRTANPTTQGISLRGIGASGTARAAVLEDGIPLNEPFGGWIYWGRVPLLALDRAEVVRGAASDLYGSAALGGVVELVRRRPDGPGAASADVSWGSRDSRGATVFASARAGELGAAVSAEAFSTPGYVPTAPGERGPVDADAGSRHTAADLALDRTGERSRMFLRGTLYDESRENGTRLQTNDVRLTEAAAGAEGSAGAVHWSVRGYGTGERFHQTFTSIAADRSSERLTRRQTVPADAEGLVAQTSASRGSHALLAGVEARRVQGESREEIVGAVPSTVIAGGLQTAGGFFVADTVSAGPAWTWTAGVRADLWKNADGRSTTQTPAGVSVTRFPDRIETAWSPRLATVFRASGAVTLTASAYRSFRAPTLNELYRSFRVGNVVTDANAALRAERLTGGEIGVSFGPSGIPIRARTTLFWTEVDDAIANRTLSTTPTLVTRRRDNLGTTRSRGADVELDVRAGNWKITGGYLFADSTVLDNPAAPELSGLRIPQVPRHQATLQAAFRRGGWTGAVQARAGGAQFEDDQNLLRLRSFFTADAFVSASLGGWCEPYLAAENLTNADVEIGRTPATSLGAPREVRLGVRIRLGR
ncbi:MAG: TonB-dependent receptor [Acidobacteriota bacterium]